MHLLDVTLFYASESGGVKRYLLAKRDWLRRHGLHHSLLVPGPHDSDDGAGIHTRASPLIPFSGGYRWPRRRRDWAAAMQALAPDLIEAGDPYGLAWTALDAGQRLGVPVVAFYHSDLPRFVGARLGAWSEPALARYVRRLYRGFDLVLAPSRVMADKLRALGVERVEQQPLGVDTAVFAPRRRDPQLRAELGLAPETRLLIYAGRFAREKNLPVLLEALRRLGPGYHLMLVGGGAPLRPQHNVSVYPYLAHPQALARLLASCDALVHAGDQETFGLVVLEAMACGRPVVGVAGGAVAELVDDAVGALARPRDAEALADVIAGLYRRDLDVLGTAARARVERGYSWDRVFGRQVARYGRLLGAEAGSRGAMRAYG